ncbi:MAG: M28 family peptidase, partial [Bacteroidota bacterium]|nr:M28 family peptidase [Bacteroidota bacterium]
VKLSGRNEFETIIDGIRNSFNAGKDFTPLGFSSSGKIEGDLVFVGYGITMHEQNYDDYKDKNGNGIDVKGKVLVMMKYSPGGNDSHDNPFQKFESARLKTVKARDAGAAGIIFINGPDSGDDYLSKLRYDNVLQNAGIPVINSRRFIIENIFKENGLDLLQIQNEIDSTKTPNSFVLKNFKAFIETNVSPVKAETSNVLGFLEGNDPVLKNEVIVIGAHKDHLGFGTYGSLHKGNDKQIHNGADDNASGISGLLELAQKLSFEKNDMKRSILFMAFGAEEAGLIGSAHFTKSKIFESMNIVAMLNMDMIGRLTDDKLIIYGTGTSTGWNDIIDSLNKKYNFKLTKTPDGFGPSDHSSFYAKNIPVLHFFSGTHSDYHSPTDDIDKINTKGEVRIADLIYDVTLALNEMQTRPDFIKVVSNNNENRSMGNVKVYVGTIPDYSFTAEGMKLSGVKEGSPAEKSGLKAADIIIKFGSKGVKNIYDYMYAMGEFKPGEEADVVILRNNEIVNLKITLGSR